MASISLLDGALLGIGNPLLDIQSVVTEDLLNKYKLQANNACLAEPHHLPLYDELNNDHTVEYIAGGSAQNTIRCANWMFQQRGVAHYIGCIGDDKWGKILKDTAEKDGVTTHYLVDKETPTGTCAVCLTGKNRSLVANLSAANKYKREHLDTPEIQALIQKAQVLYTTGFFLTVSPESAVQLGKHAVEHNKPFVWNVSAPFIPAVFLDRVKTVLPYADYVFGNETEAIALSEAMGWGTKDFKEIAAKIAELPKENSKRKRCVIITHGDKPTMIFHDGKYEEHAIVPLAADKIVDTNGAGDCYVGGFLFGLTQGKSLGESLSAGAYCAWEVIQQSGIKFPPHAPNFHF